MKLSSVAAVSGDAQQSLAETTDQVLSPDVLASTLRVDVPRGVVSIKGVVQRLTAVPRDAPVWVFGDLRGTDVTVGFRCPVNAAPQAVKDAVVITGVVNLWPSKIHQGFDLRIDGEVSGAWQSAKTTSSAIFDTMPEKQGRTSLLSLLMKTRGHGICLIATARGLSDVKSAFSSHCKEFPFSCDTSASFADSSSLLHSAIRAKETGACAIVFVRGGSDEKTLQIWDEAKFVRELLELGLPIFTAIGHSDNLLLADKYADEAFPTPTAFGAAAGNYLVSINQLAQIRSEIRSYAPRESATQQVRGSTATPVEQPQKVEGQRSSRWVIFWLLVFFFLLGAVGVLWDGLIRPVMLEFWADQMARFNQ